MAMQFKNLIHLKIKKKNQKSVEVGQNIVSNDKQTVVISVVFYFKEEEERKKKAMI